MKIPVKVRVLPSYHYAPPSYATAGSAGLDLRACLDAPVVLPARGGQALIPTGLAIHIGDPGYMAVVASRSGLANRHQVNVAQGGGGIVDSDYQGEIKVILENRGSEPFEVVPGERIAQLMLVPVIQMEMEFVDEFESKSDRGEGGFGSTGRA